MVEKKVEVSNRLGVHARPAAMVVQKANRFKSEITLQKEDLEVNGKSILSVMALAAEVGSIVTIRAEGEDEALAVKELARFFEEKFGEE